MVNAKDNKIIKNQLYKLYILDYNSYDTSNLNYNNYNNEDLPTVIPNYPTGGSPPTGGTANGGIGIGSGSGFTSPENTGSLSYNYYYNDYDQYSDRQIPSTRTLNRNSNSYANWFGQGGSNNYFRRQNVIRTGARRNNRNRVNPSNLNVRRRVTTNNRNVNTNSGFNSWFLNNIIPALSGNQNFNQNQIVRRNNRNQLRRRSSTPRQNIFNQGTQSYYNGWFG